MKTPLTILLLLPTILFAQSFPNDTTLTGTYNAGGKVMNIQGKISGNVTLTNAIIEASPFIQIFDTTVKIGANVRIKEFSGMWYGAKSSLQDNSIQLQAAIDASINRGWKLYIPSGQYKTDHPLLVSLFANNKFSQASIRMYGDAEMWGDGGTQIIYSGDSMAVGFQLNKGSTFENIIIKGKWESPVLDSLAFRDTPEQFLNQSASGGNGQGIWIDYSGNSSTRSGSTGMVFKNIQVGGFETDIQISNGATQNAEILLFENVQLGQGRYGFKTSQPQEKMNILKNIYCWASVHTVFDINRGSYFIDGANLVGPIRLFNITAGGWFPTHIQNIYAENFGRVGDFVVNTYGGELLPISISNSIFDFRLKSEIGGLSLINATGNSIKFDNCSLRYYGAPWNTSLSIKGGTFENCYFNGPVTGGGSIFVRYQGNMIVTPTMTYTPPLIDTIYRKQPPSVKVSIRSSNNNK